MVSIDQIVSHYRILAKLGEGGMGIVYKAEDLKLGRVVALKFLPQRFLADESQQTRFLHEAKAAAALSHPNICPIHSIDEHDGVPFIVMELINGGTLRQKLTAGALPVSLAIEIGCQIADALSAAHDLGIVHRDIKPENIMIRDDGLVQIMDFGLAKLRGVERLTKEGSTIGTIGYMSPEQIQGLEVDARSDIFSLGVVLYELLAGELPFKGEHEAAISYQIVNVDAPHVSSIRKEANPELEAVIATCLAKKRDDRYQYVKEVSRQLKRSGTDFTMKRSDRKNPTADLPGGNSPAAKQHQREFAKSRLRLPLWWAAGGIAAVAAFIAYSLNLFERAQELNPNRREYVLPTSLLPTGNIGLTHDGNWIAFPAANPRRIKDLMAGYDVYLMNTSGGDPRRVTNEGSPYIETVAISPDGNKIAFCGVDSARKVKQVKVVSSLGGESRAILTGDYFCIGWRPDGERIGYLIDCTDSKSGKMELWSIRPNGDDNRLEFADSLASFASSIYFSWSPDGKSVGWLRSFSNRTQEIVVRSLRSGREEQLTQNGKYIEDFCWASNGVIVYSAGLPGNTNLWMMAGSGGKATRITSSPTEGSGVHLSSDGKKLVYLQGGLVGYLWRVPIDGTPSLQLTFEEVDIREPTVSPDGRKIAFGEAAAVGSGYRISVMNLDGTNRVRMTSDDWAAFAPAIWSPDGKLIAFAGQRLERQGETFRSVCVTEVAKSQNAKMLAVRGEPISWLNDTTLIFTREMGTWLMSINGAQAKRFFEDSTWARPILSGKYILFSDKHFGRHGQWVVSVEHQNDEFRRWSRKIATVGEVCFDSKDDLFVISRGGSNDIWRIRLPGGKREKMIATLPTTTEVFTGSVSHDGKDIIYSDLHNRKKLVVIEDPFK